MSDCARFSFVGLPIPGYNTSAKSLLQNRALSCGTGPLGYGWRV